MADKTTTTVYQKENPEARVPPKWMAALFMEDEITLYLPFKSTEQYEDALYTLSTSLDRYVEINCADDLASLVNKEHLLCMTAMPYEEWQARIDKEEVA